MYVSPFLLFLWKNPPPPSFNALSLSHCIACWQTPPPHTQPLLSIGIPAVGSHHMCKCDSVVFALVRRTLAHGKTTALKKIEIWPQRPMYVAAAIAIHHSERGGGISLGGLTLVLTWLMGWSAGMGW